MKKISNNQLLEKMDKDKKEIMKTLAKLSKNQTVLHKVQDELYKAIVKSHSRLKKMIETVTKNQWNMIEAIPGTKTVRLKIYEGEK